MTATPAEDADNVVSLEATSARTGVVVATAAAAAAAVDDVECALSTSPLDPRTRAGLVSVSHLLPVTANAARPGGSDDNGGLSRACSFFKHNNELRSDGSEES